MQLCSTIKDRWLVSLLKSQGKKSSQKTYERGVALEGFHAFAAFGVPDLDKRIRGRSNEPLTGAVVHEGPDTFLMALQSSLALVSRSVPDFNCGIMGSRGELFLSCWVRAKGIDRIVMS